MNAQSSGYLAPTTNMENPRVVAGEPPTAAQASAELSPDRPPRAPSAGGPRPRGFAAMDRKLVSEIARKGGKAAHTAGTAHEFTSDEAREAGRKGGRATHAKRRATDDAAPEGGGGTDKPGEGS